LKEILRHAREVIQIEAEAVQGLLTRLDENFARGVQLLLACEGRAVVTGIGKSGLVGRKMVATLTSTGTPAAFLHPVEGLHGDLGMVTAKDVILAISNSGETSEILHLLPSLQKIGAKIIGLTGSLDSPWPGAAISSSMWEWRGKHAPWAWLPLPAPRPPWSSGMPWPWP